MTEVVLGLAIATELTIFSYKYYVTLLIKKLHSYHCTIIPPYLLVLFVFCVILVLPLLYCIISLDLN